MNIGNQIKTLRLEKKVTQEDLAARLGVSAQAVSKWETNASTPDITLLPDIATYFGVAIDELFALPEDAQYERIENMFFHERRIHPETFAQSVRFLNDQIAKNADNTRAYEDLAYLYNHKAASDHTQASEYAKRVLELAPDSKGGWVAFLEANNGACGDEWYDNHFTVIQYFKEFLAKNPKNFRGLYALIENLLKDGRYDEAIPYIKEIGEVRNNHQALMYSGDVAFGHGEVEKAKELWNKAVETHPDEWQAYCNRADRFKKLGLIKEAVADYEKCVEMQSAPHITDGLYSLAQVHEMLGDYQAAIRDNERIIEYLALDYNTTDGELVDARRREIQRLKKLS
ncbi:MAG: helix-turn-helix domain-containing protein [Roseburia sp.]|nr:helix-turn-helix domain-containing protein [Roseburia sp.]